MKGKNFCHAEPKAKWEASCGDRILSG